MTGDRRQRERRRPPLRARVEVFTRKHSLHIALFADILDLSDEGSCLLSPRELEEEDRVEVSLPQLEHPEPLRLTGRICWVERKGPCAFRCGVAFESADIARRESVKRKLRAILSSYHEQKPFRFK